MPFTSMSAGVPMRLLDPDDSRRRGTPQDGLRRCDGGDIGIAELAEVGRSARASSSNVACCLTATSRCSWGSIRLPPASSFAVSASRERRSSDGTGRGAALRLTGAVGRDTPTLPPAPPLTLPLLLGGISSNSGLLLLLLLPLPECKGSKLSSRSSIIALVNAVLSH